MNKRAKLDIRNNARTILGRVATIRTDSLGHSNAIEQALRDIETCAEFIRNEAAKDLSTAKVAR